MAGSPKSSSATTGTASVIDAAISASAANALLYAWFAAVLVSTVYVAFDAFTNNPELTVMKWRWVLVTLYIGPLGAAIYVLSCKEPAPGTHELSVAQLWKQSLGSTIHCLAGGRKGGPARHPQVLLLQPTTSNSSGRQY